MVTTREELEAAIKCAVQANIIVDKRDEMPTGDGDWKQRDIEDIIGLCLHHTGSGNTKNVKGIARYHAGPNHISDDGLPGICYHIAAPDLDEPAWLVSDPLNRVYGQGSGRHPGDENGHLLALVVLGDFDGPGHKGKFEQPTVRQMAHAIRALDWAQFVFGFGNQGLFGHHDFGKAACPGYWGMAFLDERRKGCPDLRTDLDWQHALLRWDPSCLPKYGADGVWGGECKRALYLFQKDAGVRRTGMKDPFTELKLMREGSWPAGEQG